MVGSVDFSQIRFVFLVEDELTLFGFVRKEYEKNFENRCLRL